MAAEAIANVASIFRISNQLKSNLRFMIDQFKNYLKEKINDLSQYFYICGPDAMIESIQENLLGLGVDKSKIVIEQF